MYLAISMGVVGAVLVIYGFVRGGVRTIHRNVLSRNGLAVLLGLGLITAALIMGFTAADHDKERAKLDESLVKMFGRSPDKLELEGSTLSDFRGIAHYNGKRYRIQTRPMTWGSQKRSYEVTATPLDGSP